MGTQIAGIGPSGATTSPCAAADASHFSVTTTADSGPGSFRQAMSDAQSANGGTICVSPDLGTISLSSAISYTGTGQLTLDGGGVTALLRLQGTLTTTGLFPEPQWTALTLVLTGLNFSNASVADNGAGASSAPATILTKAAPLKATAPSAPTHLSAKAHGQRLSVSWQAPRSLGGAPITRYRVTLSPGGASCTTTGALHCVITHINTQRYYRVSVRATNTAGLSPAASVTKVRG